MNAHQTIRLGPIGDNPATAEAGGGRPAWLYIHDFRASGVVRNAITYARHLASDRPVTLVAGYGDGLLRRDAETGPFEVVVLAEGARALPRLRAAPLLRRWLAGQPDGALMSCGNHGHLTAWLATRGLRHIRRIYRISTAVARRSAWRDGWRAAWMRALIADAERIALVGGALERHRVFAAALAHGKALTIPNGIDTAAARRSATAPCPHPWLEADIPVVLGIGRLRPQKDFDLLIAAAGLARGERRLRLVIVGGGSAEERARLTGLAHAAGLGEDFLLAGETGNVFAWLGRAGVFVLSSRWEGSSMALLEAMALGTPVVASCRAGDAAQVLDAGRFGIAVDRDDPAAFAAAILRQLSPDAVHPGERALHHDLGATTARYAALLD